MPNLPNEPTKELLRKKLRKIEVIDPVNASRRIVDILRNRLTAHPEFRCIALFSALKNEVDLRELIPSFPGRRFVFPRVDGASMSFHLPDDPNNLPPGAWGIGEPPADSPQVPSTEIDLFLCPGMAFTRSGLRLGRGRGYYDRYLGAIEGPRPVLYGVTFSDFILEYLPHEPHDIRMDEVIDETVPAPYAKQR